MIIDRANRKEYYKYCYQKNKENRKKSSKIWKEKNKEITKIWYEKNKEKQLALCRSWKAANLEKNKKLTSDWNKKNKHLKNHNLSKRRAIKIKATPAWLTEFDYAYIKSIYLQATTLSKLENKMYHVDHIVPLNSKAVCGLHVPWNLQILPAKENLSKGNKIDPVTMNKP